MEMNVSKTKTLRYKKKYDTKVTKVSLSILDLS